MTMFESDKSIVEMRDDIAAGMHENRVDVAFGQEHVAPSDAKPDFLKETAGLPEKNATKPCLNGVTETVRICQKDHDENEGPVARPNALPDSVQPCQRQPGSTASCLM